MKQSKFFCFVGIVLIFFVLSCEIGLGEAVDTKEPQIATKTPPVDAIIRGKFAIGGTWSDDGEADNVVVELKSTDGGNSEPITFTEKTVTDEIGRGTWSVIVDPTNKDNPIKDGKYQIIATVFDKAGHSSKEARLITIDNTAPLIVLDRPGSRPDSSPDEKKLLDAYGQKLSILGRAADDNDVDSIEINFFKDGSDIPTHTVRKTGVSNTIDETVAVFGDENYNKIYGNDKNGTIEYTCSINAYDKARQYPAEYPVKNEISGDGLLGNMTDHYYLFSELSSNLLNQHTVNELYKMLSGNYQPSKDRTASDTDVAKIIKQLKEKKVDVGKFTLNPENNPTYSISGFQSVATNQEYVNNEAACTIQIGTTLSLDITPGIDGYALNKPFNTENADDKDNYEIKLYPCAENSIDVDNAALENKIKEVYKIKPREIKFSAGSYKVVVPISGIPIDKYILVVEGQDSLGNELIVAGGSNKKYVFNLIPLNIPPVLNVDPIKSYCKANDSLVITGTVSSSAGVPVINVTLGKTTKQITSKLKDKNAADYLVERADVSNLYDYKCTLKLSDVKNNEIIEGGVVVKENILDNDGPKKIVVLADSGNNLRTKKDVQFTYDTTNPLATVETLEGKSINGENWYKTEQIKVKVSSIKEIGSGIDKIEAGIDSDGVGGSDSYVILTPREESVESGSSISYYDGYVTAPNANGKNIISFRLTDKAGNINTFSKNVFVDTTAPESIHLVSVDDEFSKPEAGQKLFAGTKLVNGNNNVKVVISAIDSVTGGSGIESVVLRKIVNNKFDNHVHKAVLSGENYEMILTGKAEGTAGIIPTSSGSGSVEFEVIDKVGNKTLFNAFNMTVDTAAPIVKINPVSDADIDSPGIDVNGEVTIEGTASDNNGIGKIQIQYKESKSGGWNNYGNPLVKSPDNSLNSWKIVINTKNSEFKDNTEYKFRAVITDEAGNINAETPGSSVSLKINQASDKPIIEFKNIGSKIENANKYSLSTDTLYVVVNDDDGTISKDHISYQILNNVPSTEPADSWKTPSDYNGGSFSIILKDAPNDVVIFKIIDGKGTEFHSVSTVSDNTDKVRIKNNTDPYLTLKVDTTAPVFGKLQFSDNGQDWEDISTFAQKAYGGNKNTFYFKQYAYDANGVESLSIKLDDKDGDDALAKKEYKFSKIGDEVIGGLTYSTWKSECIDVSNLVSGIRMSTFVVSDGAKTNKSQIMINIDNTAPRLTGIDSHESGADIRSWFLLKGSTDDENCDILYALTDSPTLPGDFVWSEENPAVKKYDYGPKSSWRIYFDGNVNKNAKAANPDGFTHDLDQKEYFGKIYPQLVDVVDGVVYKKGSTIDKFTEKKPFYFHFKLTDKLGNSSVSSGFNLLIDPQGDIPVIKLLSPEPNADSTISGIIRLQGYAEDDHTIVGLYMQIDPSYVASEGFHPWSEDSNEGLKLGYTTELINSKVAPGKQKPTNIKGIFIGEETNWNFSINKNGELDGSNGTNTIALRFFATDEDGNMSSPTADEVYVFTIDSSNPKLGSTEPFYLYQYKWVDSTDGAIYYTNTGKPTTNDKLYNEVECTTSSGKNWSNSLKKEFASMEYKPDMWVKGLWWLSGSVEDENGINKIDFGSREGVSAGQIWHTQTEIKSSTGKTNYTMNLLVGCNDTIINPYGNLKYSFTAYDNDSGGGKSTTGEFIINYDNKAPTLENDGAKFFRIDKNVVNNNGFYTLGSAAYEESGESGFDKVVFYFERAGSNKIYDAYIKKNEQDAVISTNGLTKQLGIYWKKNTINSISGNIVEVNTADSNIHAGGLVSIADSIYVIKDKKGNRLTLSGIPASNLIGSEILIAIGHVVDHRGTESNGTDLYTTNEYYGYYSNLPDDDKDKMVEKVVSSGTRTDWEGNINSNNIPDGPISIKYVVFDKAGNYKEGSVAGNVKNNAPRLASVRIWTDYNKDGQIQEDSETEGYYISGRTRQIGGKSIYKATSTADKLVIAGENNSAFMTVKDEFNFIPEIVGGNGKLYYSYEINNKNNSNKVTDTNYTSSFVNGRDDNIDQIADSKGYYKKDDEGSGYIEGNTDGKIPVTSDMLNKLGNSTMEKPTVFSYKIWDSTEGTTVGTDSLHADFSINLNVQYADTEAPSVTINKFGWENNNNNSLYHNSRKNGHIELEEDLTQEIINSLGNDPKVSGKITIKGTAKDNIRIKELKVVFPGIVGSDASTGKNHVLAATYYKGNWDSKSPDTSENMKKNHWTFTAQDISADKNGHEVAWEFNVDTEALSPVAQKDITVKVFAVGERDNKESAETVYKMDVVPYITGVKTKLSNKDTSTAVYSRTALGHYPVMSGETEVKLLGFNLGTNTSVDMSSRTSGSFSVTVNGIETLNNINKKDAGKKTVADSNSQTADISSYDYNVNMYNRQPNRENNNLLTDDVIFDVWDINNNAALPVRGNISEPVMRINPSKGLIGFAFVSGPADFSMANTGNSYQNWHRNYATFTNVSFTYDKNGVSHGTCTGIDTYPDSNTNTQGGRFSYVTSKWGPAKSLGSENNYSGDNAIRLEAIGVQGDNQIIVSGEVNPGYILDEHRFGSPSIVATVDGSTTAVYLAYYDAIQKQIRFRVNSSVGDTKTSNGDFLDNLNCETGDNKHKYIKEAGTDKFSLIAGKDYQKDSKGKTITIKGKTPSSKDFYDTGYNASPFVAIDAIPKGTVLNGESTGTTADIIVAVWYDGKDCYYSSIKGPGVGADGDDMGGTADKDGCWATPKKIFTGAGEYCAVKTDGKGGIHIAAYDISGADVKYAYIPKYSSAYNEQTDAVTVDSYAITGTNISIDVGKKTADGSYIPYISYFMPSIQSVRMAYLVAEKNGKADYKAAGTNDKDEFTGNWEVTTIPSNSRIKEDHVSIGLWKDYDSGLITNSKKASGTGNSADGSTGTCYGNGTANPVIGYAISKTTSGAIETAQMK